MADPLLRIGRSRGFDSLIRGETLDKYMREAIKKEVEPEVAKEYKKYIDRFGLKPKVETNVQVGQVRGQVLTVRITGNQIAVDRWNMIDKKGRKGGKKIKSTKFKTVKRKGGVTRIARKAAKGRAKDTEKGGTYKRPVPMPLAKYDSKIAHFGEAASGSGGYKNFTGRTQSGWPEREDVIFRTSITQGEVKPLYITRDIIAPVLRKKMTVSVENAYRRAFRAILGRGI